MQNGIEFRPADLIYAAEALEARLGGPTPVPDRMLTYDEAAERLQVSRHTVAAYCRTGRLPSVALGHRTRRINGRDLAGFIARCTRDACTPALAPPDVFNEGGLEEIQRQSAFKRSLSLPDRLLTYSEVAGRAQVMPETVATWGRLRMLSVVHLGHRSKRIKPEDLASFLYHRTRQG